MSNPLAGGYCGKHIKHFISPPVLGILKLNYVLK